MPASSLAQSQSLLSLQMGSSMDLSVPPISLTENRYLIGFRGAIGTPQITSGLPVWCAVPLENESPIELSGSGSSFRLYLAEQMPQSGGNVQPKLISEPIELGIRYELTPSGKFVSVGTCEAGTVELLDTRLPDALPMVVGLTADIQGNDHPFCAFQSEPGTCVEIEPTDKVFFAITPTPWAIGQWMDRIPFSGCTWDFGEWDGPRQLWFDPALGVMNNAEGTEPVRTLGPGVFLPDFLNTPF
ncbi:hypothetical protein [Pontibacter sp. G13]|uniref:hypothetical protein n=1 Tax=Pontibacter sp. G13 TaxID=3074898 RepID=UPI00288B434B|nr:hypothetical protein [Pontibacter sp. G13]WNJ17091.1 hypothetical protein RJD25_19730 [Pontibacter sp. G13]